MLSICDCFLVNAAHECSVCFQTGDKDSLLCFHASQESEDGAFGRAIKFPWCWWTVLKTAQGGACMGGNKDEINKEWKWSYTSLCISEAFMIIGVAGGFWDRWNQWVMLFLAVLNLKELCLNAFSKITNVLPNKLHPAEQCFSSFEVLRLL